eukprot:TRINITY_DN2454_c0_g1_i3.p1 TRINITY_DN2454_c0_g1~~TRINITY_DN2454_c0_g1_i3.p1  ORF type:complete len:878 (-),score=148.47 TRINITY_DN2454_c0_g1_i3:1835-4468(-)
MIEDTINGICEALRGKIRTSAPICSVVITGDIASRRTAIQTLLSKLGVSSVIIETVDNCLEVMRFFVSSVMSADDSASPEAALVLDLTCNSELLISSISIGAKCPNFLPARTQENAFNNSIFLPLMQDPERWDAATSLLPPAVVAELRAALDAVQCLGRLQWSSQTRGITLEDTSDATALKTLFGPSIEQALSDGTGSEASTRERCASVGMLIYQGVLQTVEQLLNKHLQKCIPPVPDAHQTIHLLDVMETQDFSVGNDWPQLMRNCVHDAMTSIAPMSIRQQASTIDAGEFRVKDRTVAAVVERFLQRCGMTRNVAVIDGALIKLRHASTDREVSYGLSEAIVGAPLVSRLGGVCLETMRSCTNSVIRACFETAAFSAAPTFAHLFANHLRRLQELTSVRHCRFQLVCSDYAPEFPTTPTHLPMRQLTSAPPIAITAPVFSSADSSAELRFTLSNPSLISTTHSAHSSAELRYGTASSPTSLSPATSPRAGSALVPLPSSTSPHQSPPVKQVPLSPVMMPRSPPRRLSFSLSAPPEQFAMQPSPSPEKKLATPPPSPQRRTPQKAPTPQQQPTETTEAAAQPVADEEAGSTLQADDVSQPTAEPTVVDEAANEADMQDEAVTEAPTNEDLFDTGAMAEVLTDDMLQTSSPLELMVEQAKLCMRHYTLTKQHDEVDRINEVLSRVQAATIEAPERSQILQTELLPLLFPPVRHEYTSTDEIPKMHHTFAAFNDLLLMLNLWAGSKLGNRWLQNSWLALRVVKGITRLLKHTLQQATQYRDYEQVESALTEFSRLLTDVPTCLTIASESKLAEMLTCLLGDLCGLETNTRKPEQEDLILLCADLIAFMSAHPALHEWVCTCLSSLFPLTEITVLVRRR